MKQHVAAPFASVTLLLALSCREVELPTAPQSDDEVEALQAATFSRVQNEVLTPSCALGGCHIPPFPPEGLDLTADRSYGNLVNQSSSQIPSLLRVKPGDPDQSYLYRKILGRPGIVGSRMPLIGPALTQAQINLIRDWIAVGARADTPGRRRRLVRRG